MSKLMLNASDHEERIGWFNGGVKINEDIGFFEYWREFTSSGMFIGLAFLTEASIKIGVCASGSFEESGGITDGEI